MRGNSRVGRKVPGQRQVNGCLGDVGYIIKRPGHGIKTEQILEHHAKIRYNAICLYKDTEALKNERFLNEYYKKFDMSTVRASANYAVQLGVNQLERDMAGKQNRLRSVLLDEQSEQITEYIHKAQVYANERNDESKRKAEDILKTKGDSERRRAQEVYTRMALETSDAYKSKLSMEQLKIVQEANKELIRLKLLQKSSDKEYESYWTAEVDKCGTMMAREEAVEKADKTAKHQDLNKQIEERKRVQRNEVCIEEFNVQRRKVIQDEEYRKLDLRAEDAKRRELLGFQTLTQQIDDNKTLAARNRLEELLVDHIMLNHNRKVMETEQAAIRHERAQNWNELVIFKQALVDYRNAWHDRAQESGILANEYEKGIELKKYKARRARENLNKDLTIECFESAERKVAENIVTKGANKQMVSKAGELAVHYNAVNNRLSSAFEKEKSKELNPAPYNDESLKYLKVLQNRQRLEDQELLERAARQNDVRQKEVIRVLERPVQESFKHQHPMYHVLKSK